MWIKVQRIRKIVSLKVAHAYKVGCISKTFSAFELMYIYTLQQALPLSYIENSVKE